MPGIFGVVDWPPRQADESSRERLALVRRMAAAMLHEPFYSGLIVSSPVSGAAAGCVVIGESGPDVNGSSPLVLTTGEAPEVDLAESASGEDVVRAVAFRRSGFVADERLGACFFFNDRYGRERLFVYRDGRGRTIFSSEAKAILAVVPETRSFDPAGIADLLACGCTLGTKSLFRNIEVLPPGTLYSFSRRAGVEVSALSSKELEETPPVSKTEFVNGFSTSLRESVNSAIARLPRTAVSVTGGLDSRMVMACLDGDAVEVPCYTFGSMYRTTGDVAVGRRVASACGHPHRVITVGRDFLGSAPDTFTASVYISDGYLGLPGAAELHVNRVARSMAPARMTGNWGGELMRGVRAFKFRVPHGNFVGPELDRLMKESAAAEFSRTPANSLSAALFNQIPLQGYGRYAIERSQVATLSPFLASGVVRWLYGAPPAVRGSIETAAAVIGQRPALLGIPTDIGLLGRGPSPVRTIRRAWRRAIVKAEYLTSHGAPDWVARVSARIPAALLEKRFLGVDKFSHFRFWLRTDLAPFARDVLSGGERGLADYFDVRAIRRMVDDHIDGRANYTDEIDKMLTLAVARRVLFTPVHVAKGPVREFGSAERVVS